MDAKITLSFDREIIHKAKQFAESNNISLSRLTEFLLNKAISSKLRSIDELPVSDWIDVVSEGRVEYVRRPKSGKELRNEFLDSSKKGSKSRTR